MTTVERWEEICAVVAEMLPGLKDAILPELKQAIQQTVSAVLHERMLTVEQAAEVANCSPAALRKRIARCWRSHSLVIHRWLYPGVGQRWFS